jgi:hypothetical protein
MGKIPGLLRFSNLTFKKELLTCVEYRLKKKIYINHPNLMIRSTFDFTCIA